MTSRTIRRLGLIAAALAALATASSAQAVTYLQLGTSNTSNATTTLKGSAAGAELKVVDTNGSASTAGVLGLLTATSPTVNSAALRGQNNATNGLGFGVSGSHAGAGIGVNGFSPRGIGIRGQSTSGIGVSGQHTATTGTGAGVRGLSGAPSGISLSGGSGVWGDSSSRVGVFGSSGNTGVYGSSSSGTGVYGQSSSNVGVYGLSETNWAGYFAGGVTVLGDVNVTGTLTKGGGAFRIDHPLDPAHKYLQHSFVESPDMMDVYNGNVTTNKRGFATVRLPRYFQALNRSFRYQLTSLSGLQEVAIAKQIAHNRFTIQSEKPHSKISWQVTGIRHDRFANAHPIQVVVPKAKKDQGKYLHTELYGKPKAQAIGYQKPPAITRRSEQTP